MSLKRKAQPQITWETNACSYRTVSRRLVLLPCFCANSENTFSSIGSEISFSPKRGQWRSEVATNSVKQFRIATELIQTLSFEFISREGWALFLALRAEVQEFSRSISCRRTFSSSSGSSQPIMAILLFAWRQALTLKVQTPFTAEVATQVPVALVIGGTHGEFVVEWRSFILKRQCEQPLYKSTMMKPAQLSLGFGEQCILQTLQFGQFWSLPATSALRVNTVANLGQAHSQETATSPRYPARFLHGEFKQKTSGFFPSENKGAYQHRSCTRLWNMAKCIQLNSRFCQCGVFGKNPPPPKDIVYFVFQRKHPNTC